MKELWEYDAVGLTNLYLRGEQTPGDVVSSILKRIDLLQPTLNAYSVMDKSIQQSAEASNERWARGKPIGLLDGVPMIVKDNLASRGLPASWGNASLAKRVIKHDELPVSRLREAGALVLGKGNCPEFAVEGYTSNAVFGTTGNPFDPKLTSGGSSGGVVSAVASGQATIGIGTDGGGSIRRPAGYTGLIGLKPGIGHIPRAFGLPQLLLDFEVVGPITRSVRDARLMDRVMHVQSRSDPVARRRLLDVGQPINLSALKVLYVPRFAEAPCETSIIASSNQFVDRLVDLGCRVKVGDLPLEIESLYSQWTKIGEVGLANLFDNDSQIATSAAGQYQEMAERGRQVGATQLWSLLTNIVDLRKAASELFENTDLIVTPTSAAMPWSATQAFPEIIDKQRAGPRSHAIYTGWVNAIGHPAIALPAPTEGEGMPIGVQLVGDIGSEQKLLDIAERYESLHGDFKWPASNTLMQ